MDKKRNRAWVILAVSIIAGCTPHVRTTEADGVYTLTQGDLSISVSTRAGGKVTSLKRDGKEMLVQPDVHPKYYGAVLWASPQRDYWPPSPTLDNGHYQVETLDNGIRLTSEKDTLTGLRFTKEFALTPDTTIHVRYTIENVCREVKCVAAWDVMRVHGGVTFFPFKDMDLEGLASDLAHTSTENGILWYDYVQEPLSRGQKLFATTQSGWLAHYHKGLLLVKHFPLIDKEDLPPLQGEVEIFVAPNGSYVELENHGRYTELHPGQSIHYQEEWELVAIGNAPTQNKLLELVQ